MPSKPEEKNDLKSIIQIGIAVMAIIVAVIIATVTYLPQLPSVFFAPLSKIIALADSTWIGQSASEVVRFDFGDITFLKDGTLRCSRLDGLSDIGSGFRAGGAPEWRWQQKDDSVSIQSFGGVNARFDGRILYGAVRRSGRAGNSDSLVGTWTIDGKSYPANYRFGSYPDTKNQGAK